MGKLGLNWSRIWANHWDGKNPFWVKGDQLKFDESALDKWESIIKGAERGGIKFQFVLFHHGPWSSRVNSNWVENPMNKKNGGFLDKPLISLLLQRRKRLRERGCDMPLLDTVIHLPL